MRNFVIFFLLFLLSFLIGFFVFTYIRGGKYYFEAKNLIDKTPSEKRTQALSIFNPQGENLHGGVYINAIGGLIPGVLIWGEKGPRFFKTGEYSAFSLYIMCGQTNFKGLEEGEIIKPKREIYNNLSAWKKLMNYGNFVIVRTKDGIMREIEAYDWWVFDTINTIETICER